MLFAYRLLMKLTRQIYSSFRTLWWWNLIKILLFSQLPPNGLAFIRKMISNRRTPFRNLNYIRRYIISFYLLVRVYFWFYSIIDVLNIFRTVWVWEWWIVWRNFTFTRSMGTTFSSAISGSTRPSSQIISFEWYRHQVLL